MQYFLYVIITFVMKESSDFEEVELQANSADISYQPTKDSSLVINSPSVHTSNIQKYSDMDINNDIDIERIQANALINKDANLNFIKNPSDMSIENCIEIPSDETDESKSDASEISNFEEEIPKQLSEEESEFARFLSELKKRDLDLVQKELNTEVLQLNEQRRREKRDSDSVTQIMISECQVG
jgi:hypothetical protein